MIEAREIVKFVFAIPLGIIALFFLYIGWRRGNRFNFHEYQGNQKERLRDNFFSHFTIICSMSCLFPIISPIKIWFVMIPLTLLLILIATPVSMLGAYWGSFLANIMSGGKVRNHILFLQNIKEVSILEWYEFAPFALVIGWIIYWLVYAALLFALGIEMTSENAPDWSIFVALAFGIVVAFVVTIGIHRKFKNAKTS